MRLWPEFAFFSVCQALSPIPCLQTSTTFEALVACFDTFTVPPNFYTDDTYTAAQPAAEELQGWNDLVSAVLSVDGNCTSLTVPSPLADIYTISSFPDDSGAQYCVASETYAENGAYAKGWGLFAVPATHNAIRLDIHLSAPHPQFDLFTPEQAGALFKAVGARSLLIAGRQRMSYAVPSDCVIPTDNTTVYYKTDPAHDTNEPFFPANIVIRDWQNAHGGCPAATCAFIQLHGKAASTCPTDTMFLSSGLGRSAASIAWYTDTVDRPVKRIKQSLISAFTAAGHNFTFSLPSDSECSLTATDNVFGRLLNGVDVGEVCTRGASAEETEGEFVHIEQAIGVREDATGIYDAWAEALKGAFPLPSGIPDLSDSGM
ncbi:hypothetical protein C8F01DRAFT_281409 [Mycena amicta]|nr:hypothetical protein C8F01DRAFT_281409 [Mycena amicta]